ncbi:hypothetical protein NVP1063O_097 [Vibrio phage 1.063.O._10N.261.45.C7]|nr:hypothetical protein NVP1063O_097 [Vibrio phage 1.063.O._10N.261.45.C7]
MSWFYGEPMNDRDVDLYFNGLTFKCKFCDLRETLVVEDHYDMLNKQPLEFAKAYGTFIGYHSSVIRPELNGFQGYDCIQLSIVEKFKEF